MMEHFEEELDRAGFFFPEAKKAPMVQNLRNAFTRAGWTPQEISTFRGAIKALAIGQGQGACKTRGLGQWTQFAWRFGRQWSCRSDFQRVSRRSIAGPLIV